jgi:hypothetical protein
VIILGTVVLFKQVALLMRSGVSRAFAHEKIVAQDKLA